MEEHGPRRITKVHGTRVKVITENWAHEYERSLSKAIAEIEESNADIWDIQTHLSVSPVSQGTLTIYSATIFYYER